MKRSRIEEWRSKLLDVYSMHPKAYQNEIREIFGLALKATEPGMVSLQHETGSWAEQQFPESSPDSVINHAREEFRELVIVVSQRNEEPEELALSNVGEESADVVLLIMHLCHKLGIDLEAECRAKLARNKKRKWDDKPNAEGYYKHVAQEDQS